MLARPITGPAGLGATAPARGVVRSGAVHGQGSVGVVACLDYHTDSIATIEGLWMWDTRREVAMSKTKAAKLATYEQRYRDLARQLAEIGFIVSGNVALRYNRCGKTYCACHSDPPRLRQVLLALHGQGQRQDRQQAPHRNRGPPLPGMDRQRPHRPCPAQSRCARWQHKPQELLLAEEASEDSRPRSRSTSPQSRRSPAPALGLKATNTGPIRSFRPVRTTVLRLIQG